MRGRTALLVMLATAPLSAVVASQAKPNFTGTWTLDRARSDLSAGVQVTSIVYVTEHSDPTLKLTRTANGVKDEASFTTDGKESRHSMSCCGPATTKAKWDEGALRRETVWEGGSQRDTWTLSTDGKTLTIVRVIAEGGTETTNRMVFGKKDPDK